jgi:hypothetical protein
MKRVPSGDPENFNAVSWVNRILEDSFELRAQSSHLDICEASGSTSFYPTDSSHQSKASRDAQLLASGTSVARMMGRTEPMPLDSLLPVSAHQTSDGPGKVHIHSRARPQTFPSVHLSDIRPESIYCDIKFPSVMTKPSYPKIRIPTNKNSPGGGFSSRCSEFKGSPLCEILLDSTIDDMWFAGTTSSSCPSLTAFGSINPALEVEVLATLPRPVLSSARWQEPNFYALSCGCCDLVFEGYEGRWRCSSLGTTMAFAVIPPLDKWDILDSSEDEPTEEQSGLLDMGSDELILQRCRENQLCTLADLQPEQARQVPTWMALGKTYLRSVGKIRTVGESTVKDSHSLKYGYENRTSDMHDADEWDSQKREQRNARCKIKECAVSGNHSSDHSVQTIAASSTLLDTYSDYASMNELDEYQHEALTRLWKPMGGQGPWEISRHTDLTPSVSAESLVTGLTEAKLGNLDTMGSIMNESRNTKTCPSRDITHPLVGTESGCRPERQASWSRPYLLSKSSNDTDDGYSVRQPESLLEVPPNTRAATPVTGEHKYGSISNDREFSINDPFQNIGHRQGFRFTAHSDDFPQGDRCRESSFGSLFSSWRDAAEDKEYGTELQLRSEHMVDHIDKEGSMTLKRVWHHEKKMTGVKPGSSAVTSAASTTRRVGDLISLFQGHGIMPQIRKLNLNGSPPRTPSTNENFGPSHHSTFFPRSGKRADGDGKDYSLSALQFRSYSPYIDDDTEMSSSFGEELERTRPVSMAIKPQNVDASHC